MKFIWAILTLLLKTTRTLKKHNKSPLKSCSCIVGKILREFFSCEGVLSCVCFQRSFVFIKVHLDEQMNISWVLSYRRRVLRAERERETTADPCAPPVNMTLCFRHWCADFSVDSETLGKRQALWRTDSGVCVCLSYHSSSLNSVKCWSIEKFIVREWMFLCVWWFIKHRFSEGIFWFIIELIWKCYRLYSRVKVML